MKTTLKPANEKARALLKKLQALAERGIAGERTSAQHKITRLLARFDFNGADHGEPLGELFAGKFKRSTTVRRIYNVRGLESDVANSVKWAIESATKIPCVYRDGNLMAEAAAGTVGRLTEIAAHLANNFNVLLKEFGAVAGVSANDRRVFVMGLYDGMMNETRDAGQSLPSRPRPKKPAKVKPGAATAASGLHVHPYTVAWSLGKQIRFSVPTEQIAAELKAVTQKHLAH